MPVRNVSNHGGNITGAIPSRKLGRMVHFESLTERAYLYLLEHDPQVARYEEQPCRIRYQIAGREHHYTPDVAVFWREGLPSLIECKPAARLDDPDNQAKWMAARLWCAQHGYTFAVVTEALAQQHAILLDNLGALAGHAYQRYAPQALDAVLAVVQAAGGPLTVSAAVERLPQIRPQHARACIWHLLATGTLLTDLTKPLHVKTTLVSLGGDFHASALRV
jgi:hypothetical protein